MQKTSWTFIRFRSVVDARMDIKLMGNQSWERHRNQKVEHSILLLFAMKINDFRGLAGLWIHEKSVEKRWKICTGSDIRFWLIWDWFLIDFGSILRSCRQPKVIKHQWKFKSKFVEAFGRVSSGFWDTFGAIWEVQEWFPGEWGCINDAGQRVGGGQGEGFICICI